MGHDPISKCVSELKGKFINKRLLEVFYSFQMSLGHHFSFLVRNRVIFLRFSVFIFIFFYRIFHQSILIVSLFNFISVKFKFEVRNKNYIKSNKID